MPPLSSIKVLLYMDSSIVISIILIPAETRSASEFTSDTPLEMCFGFFPCLLLNSNSFGTSHYLEHEQGCPDPWTRNTSYVLEQKWWGRNEMQLIKK